MRTLTATALVGGALLLYGGCATDDPSDETNNEPTAPAIADPGLEHVHGLGVDPADDQLYAASHFGLFRIAEDGSFTRIADRWQDTMAFTVVGPHEFLASGHPDLREDLPPNLGLIASADAGETWTSVSLNGEADFHALDVSGRRTYGYDSLGERLLASSDRETWVVIATGPMLDIAADPADPDHVLAVTASGDLVAHEAAGNPAPIQGAPGLALIDWPDPDLLVGVTIEGEVYRSRDGGTSWRPLANAPPGQPQALDVTRGRWHIATEHGIFTSRDDGSNWKPVLRAGG